MAVSRRLRGASSLLGGNAEILLGDLARLDFGVTGWQEAAPEGTSEEEPPAAPERGEAIGSAGPEPMRVKPIQLDPAPRESSRPEPVHFEPVHIDPVFMEQIAATAEFNALKTAQGQVSSLNGQEPVEAPPSQPDLAVETAAPETGAVRETWKHRSRKSWRQPPLRLRPRRHLRQLPLQSRRP